VNIRTGFVVASLGLLLLPAAIAVPNKEKEKEDAGQSVDSGSFGVFMNGRRVATETFSIQQDGKGSSVTSEFKSEQGLDKALQSSELQLDANGEIRKYEWKETLPEKITATVTPNDQFLSEQVSTGPGEKPLDQPFLLPASTSILDDYFLVHREILLWKYLATGCHQEKGQLKCPMHERAQFGTLNPHSRSSAPVTVEFSGKEKVTLRGTERELNRFDLKGEAGDWAFWMDDQFKLVRIVIADENTEVLRD
jgi:hypothetical protein